MGIRKKLNELLGLTDSVKEEKSRCGLTGGPAPRDKDIDEERFQGNASGTVCPARTHSI